MSTEDISAILSRISALIQLAENNANENERANAQKAAQKLISKFQITQEQLRNAKSEKEDPFITKEVFSGHKARIVWKEKVIGKVCKTNGCFHLVNNWHNPRAGINYTAHGRTSALKIVEILIDHIINQIEWLAKNSGLKGKAEATSFKLGCAQKVCERLEEGRKEAIEEYKKENNLLEEQTSTALVRFDNALVEAKKNLELTGVQFASIKSRIPVVKESAYSQGKKAGNLINLQAPNKALKG